MIYGGLARPGFIINYTSRSNPIEFLILQDSVELRFYSVRMRVSPNAGSSLRPCLKGIREVARCHPGYDLDYRVSSLTTLVSDIVNTKLAFMPNIVHHLPYIIGSEARVWVEQLQADYGRDHSVIKWRWEKEKEKLYAESEKRTFNKG